MSSTHGFGGDDLVNLGIEQSQTSELRYATFQVLSFSLSKLNILPGDILRLRLLEKDEIPTEISIVAVKVHQTLLLRHFLPPVSSIRTQIALLLGLCS